MCLVYVVPLVWILLSFSFYPNIAFQRLALPFSFLCVIIRFFFLKTRSSISASCCWVCMSKYRAWVADICDVLVNDGVRAASTTNGDNSFSFGAVSVPVVVASKSVRQLFFGTGLYIFPTLF